MSETESFIERLNRLSLRRKNDSFSFDIFHNSTFFNTDSIDNWDLKIDSLCNDFKQLQGYDERSKWFKKLLMEIFAIITHEKFRDLPINVSNIAQLLNKLCSNCDVTMVKTVGKLFISVSSVLPQFFNNPVNETILVELTELVEPIHMEIFKFSWLSSKLSERKQTILLRHLLKKSKYELHKFNLLSENAIGFAQLSTLFINFYQDSGITGELVDPFVKEMYHVMGKYSLDPMRCLDVFLLLSSEYVLTDYSRCVDFLQRTDFINHASKRHENNLLLSNVVLFNLQEINDLSPNYWNLIAVLVKFGLLDATQIWNNLSPDNDTLVKSLDKLEVILENESMKGVDNPLAMAAALTNEDEEGTHSTDKEGDIVMTDSAMEEKTTSNPDADDIEKWKSSKKVQFLKHLIIHGSLANAVSIIREQPRLLLLDDEITKLLSRCFEYIIDPLYQLTPYRSKIVDSKLQQSLLITNLDKELINFKPRLFVSKKSFDIDLTTELNVQFQFYFTEWTQDLAQINTPEELFKIFHQYLALLGPHLASCPALVTKLVRIGVNDINKDSSTTERWIDYVRKFIFPTTPLYESNTFVTTEIYNLMKLFPFEKRYFMYNEMLTRLSQDSLAIKIGFNKAEREAKTVLKALSIDSIAKESRNLSQLISSNPLATLVPAVKQIENYDKVSELLIYTTKFFNEFSYDVLQYVLLLRLTHQRSAIQSDGVTQAPWVQRLAVFIAGLAKKCAQMNLSNIITYIIKTLHNADEKTNTIAVAILKELIITVGGIRDQNEVTFKSLIMLNSGEPIKQEGRKLIYDSRDSNIAVAKSLVSLFIDQNSISEIILLIYRLNLKANTTDSHYKILSSRCDSMNTLLWSFIELVKFCCDDQKLVENVLPFEYLTDKFHVSAPWVFNIWRDYIDQKENEKVDATSNATSHIITSFDDVMEKATFHDVDFTHLSRDLFITFWKLSLYDIHLDKKVYDELKEKLEVLERKEASPRKKNAISNKIKNILVSFISHQKTFNHTKNILHEKRKTWLEGFNSEEVKALLQYAIIPRILFTPSDAVYSALFILQSFEFKETFKIFNTLVTSNIVETLLFSCTSAEAGNLGMFFFTVIESIEKKRKENDETITPYKRELYEWQHSIVRQIINCLSAKNYMSIRNGIEFMKHVSLIFPVVDTHLKMLCSLLEENLVSEEREDIKLPTNALLGYLKARLKSHSVKLEEFCELNEEELKEKEQYDLELKEIEQYEVAYANEQKQLEIRKRLESNKLQREQQQEKLKKEKLSLEEKLNNLPTAPSSTALSQKGDAATSVKNDVPEWKLSTVIRSMEDTMEALKVNNVEGAFSFIPDKKVHEKLRDLSKNKDKPLNDYRDEMFEVLNGWFTSLVHHPNNPDFIKQVEALKHSVSYLSNQDISSMEDMYGETVPTTKKTSRYSNKDSSEKTTTKPVDRKPLTSIPTQPSSSAAPIRSGPRQQYSNSSKHGDRENDRSAVTSREPSNRPGDNRSRDIKDSRGQSNTGRKLDSRSPERFAPPKGPGRSTGNRYDPSKGDRNSSKNDRYSGKDARSTSRDTRYSGSDDRSTSKDTRYSGNDSRSKDTRYSGKDDRSTSRDARYSGKDDRNTSRDTRYASTDDRSTGRDARYSGKDDRSSSRDTRYASTDDRSSNKDDRTSGRQEHSYSFKRSAPARDSSEPPNKKRNNNVGQQRDHRQSNSSQSQSHPPRSSRYDDNKNPRGRNHSNNDKDDSRNALPQGPKNQGSRYQR